MYAPLHGPKKKRSITIIDFNSLAGMVFPQVANRCGPVPDFLFDVFLNIYLI